jgi:type II secretory pathway pseudopilin PulG
VPATARPDSGFTLVEALVAAALVIGVVGGLAHLAAAGASRSRAARSAGVALALAQGKLEELRGATWTYDAAGSRMSDPLLAESPPDALEVDHGGWHDAFDAFGRAVPAADIAAAAYRRRWSIGRFDPADEDTLALRVCVRPVVAASAAGQGLPDACLSTLLTRKP